MTKMWWLGACDDNGDIKNRQNIDWNSGWFSMSCWTRTEQSYSEKDDVFTWGQMIGVHGGNEKATEDAAARGEIEPRVVVDKSGKEHKMWAIKSFAGYI